MDKGFWHRNDVVVYMFDGENDRKVQQSGRPTSPDLLSDRQQVECVGPLTSPSSHDRGIRAPSHGFLPSSLALLPAGAPSAMTGSARLEILVNGGTATA
jgi:hypothetical protein